MRSRRTKVVVAMSGGVDSSVSAGLLLDRGYDVQGVSLRLWEGHAGPRVCSDHRGAREVAATLGIPHTLLDARSQFVETVVKAFAKDYSMGRTPNPCLSCNRDFKLGMLLDWATQRGADYVATGHYARTARDESAAGVCLLRGVDRDKDQSYFLFALKQEQLARTLFPLGEMHKSEVRDQARRWALPVAERPESQDICFGDYKALVESYADKKDLVCGEVVDRSGRVLGRHGGIHGVTIGQRRGLGISAARALYVVEVEADTKRIVVGNKDELQSCGLVARDVHWIAPLEEENISAEVQIRYRSPAVPCAIRNLPDGSSEVRFEKSSSAVTPGQAAVFYRGDRLLGGGWIKRGLSA